MSAVVNEKCSNYGIGSDSHRSCQCPERSLPPTVIPELPCAPTKENVPQIKKFLLEHFGASAFNVCEQQPLPLMETAPPMRLFVDKQATPTAVMNHATIPLHWEKDVKAGLERDVRLGVIEKVPLNDPVQWCSRMIITPKSDGTPRRVIDFTPINNQ